MFDAPVFAWRDGEWKRDIRWPSIGSMPPCSGLDPWSCPRCNAMLHADLSRAARRRKEAKDGATAPK